jgi:hypothetical protein
LLHEDAFLSDGRGVLVLVAGPLDLDALAGTFAWPEYGALVVAMRWSPRSPRSWWPGRSTSTCSW